ncbi:MAG: FAD-binding oxidoreductase [Flavobacteriales bacterium]|nr:FAD-binding oxidoreductase [Flavobacteriales bacterium]MCB9192098.1 FAD-binding oxidoreductase [Flavobacteriales bacterium]
MTDENRAFPPSLSYWEISEYLTNLDLVVIGSGIVGLTSAIFYRKLHPNAKVLVLEKGILPAGASTKNAGFACFGSLSELLADMNLESEEAVFNLVKQRVDGLNSLRKLIGDEKLKYDNCGGYELFLEGDEELFQRCVSFLDPANKNVLKTLGLKSTYSVCDDSILKFGFGSVKHLILNRHEGSIDTAAMMSSLVSLAQSLGIRILNGCHVSSWSDLNDSVRVELNGNLEVRCKRLHVATNGFAKELLTTEDVAPARAQVLITKPIEGLKVRGTFHMEEGFYYFRNVDNRLLLGGGRNLDKTGETTTELKTTELIQNKLESLLENVIFPETPFEIEHRWSGVMGVGQSKAPIVKQVSDHVTCAVRMGGMGVALGTSIGRQSADLIG